MAQAVSSLQPAFPPTTRSSAPTPLSRVPLQAAAASKSRTRRRFKFSLMCLSHRALRLLPPPQQLLPYIRWMRPRGDTRHGRKKCVASRGVVKAPTGGGGK